MKIKGLFIGSILGVIIALSFAGNVKAIGMPCTEAELINAQALKLAADNELAVALANKSQADMAVQLLKAQGITYGIDWLIATDRATNAANIVAAYQGKVANAQKYVDELVSRATTEQYQLDMEAKWRNRAILDNLAMQLNAVKGTPMYDQVLLEYNAMLNSNAWATDADNANYVKFVTDYGTSLQKTRYITGQDGQVSTTSYYCPDKPNEWSIRWFE